MLYLTTTIPTWDNCALAKVDSVDLAEALVENQQNKSPGDDEGEHTGVTRSFLRDYKLVSTLELGTEMSQSLGLKLHVSEEGEPGQYDRVYLYCSGQWFAVEKLAEKPTATLDRVVEASLTERKANREQRLERFGLDVEKVLDLLYDEGYQYQGYPDDSGRDKLAASAGLSREQLDSLLKV